ncbi:FKBP-type peptidyl-prolyl cis-trans isomerase [Patescibacteria group bacterium]|nr:FKBP-type peptidyl-prolyl cis-trans isomerase [Patescibacteria group bacterium]
MDKRFLYVMGVVAVILAILLAANDLKKKEPSILDKLTTTPTPAIGVGAQYVTQAPPPTAIPTIPMSASPSAMETLEEGLMIGDIRVGTGKQVKAGDTIIVNYSGALENGAKFDSSYDRGQPLEFQIGTGKVIKGWDLGVVGIKEGGKRRLIIPPELGYGAAGAGNGAIPPNATLIFDVEVLKIK